MFKSSFLFASSEVYPFAKSGGLADVAHSLPRALRTHHDVDVIMPLYRFVDRDKFLISPLGESYEVIMGGVSYLVELYGCEYEGISYHFIYSPLLCERDFLYGPPASGYEDNALRFGLFNHAIVALLKKYDYEIIHLNDWQCALVPVLIKEEESIQTKTLFTIHNLAYQGTFKPTVLKDLGIDEKYYTMQGMEFYDQVSFMKAGVAYADMITTVSPTYAKEILTKGFGCGLEGFLAYHQDKIVGIVNGIDTKHFSPSKDKALVEPYVDLRGKAVNKSAYLEERGLKSMKKPLFVFIGRFTWQKGMDLLIEALERMAAYECNISILGEGEEKYHDAIKAIADEHVNIHMEFGYDESLSHRMYAAADFLLMPSLFEPCGLNQLIAMNYGQIPIVHRVGGLADTVQDYKGFDTKSTKGYGITFAEANVSSLIEAIDQALELYANKRHYNTIIKHNMLCDFSWQESAKTYLKLYTAMIEKRENG